MKILPLALFAATLIAGCAFNAETTPDQSSNTCSTNSDCGDGSACAPTVAGSAFCAATTAELGKVILEVRSSTSNESFVFFDQLELSGADATGLVKGVDLQLPQPVLFHATLAADANTPDRCKATDGTIPFNVTLHRKADFPQFRADVVASAPIAADPLSDGTTARVETSVNPGLYDVHLNPIAIEGCELSPASPRIFSNVAISGDPSFDLPADPTLVEAKLTGNITVPVDVSLEGWVVEVVDPFYGDVVSQSFTIQAPQPQQSSVALGEGGLGIGFFPVNQAVLRLRSPDGSLMVHFDLGALDLDSNNNVEVDLRDLVATPMAISAHVIDASGLSLPNAQVDIQSVSLTGSAKQNASFNTVAQADAEGNISVSLVPGEYIVTIVPDAPGNAVYFGQWVITDAQGGSGKGFQLTSQPQLEGSLVDPLGVPLASVPLSVTPVTVTPAAPYFNQALGAPLLVTRQFSSVSDLDGGFSLMLDPGRVDLSVRMPASSGFPWLVVPSLVVDEAADKPSLDLGVRSVEYPAIAQGHVGSADQDLPLALVRAWVVSGDVESGQTLIQIGETNTDASGNFVLPLPPRITLGVP